MNRPTNLKKAADVVVAAHGDVAAANAGHAMHISLLGAKAILFEAPGAMDLATQRRIWALASRFAQWPGVAETVPGMANLMLTFHTPPARIDDLQSALRDAWEEVGELHIEGRHIDLPVIYGGDGGPHLADVMAHTGLGIDEIVHLHAQPLYTVYALGSHPGYCYLGGMDPRIATPRRKVPVVRLPGGAVSIGGEQTGVSASAGPSGWNTIGHAEMRFFDPHGEPPAVLAPGDTLRFTIAKVIK